MSDYLRYRRLRNAAPMDKSDDWLAFVRQNPCMICGQEPTADTPITAHHTTAGHHGGARADFSAVPLCPTCHLHAENNRDLHTDCALVWLPLFLMRVLAQAHNMDLKIDLTENA